MLERKREEEKALAHEANVSCAKQPEWIAGFHGCWEAELLAELHLACRKCAALLHRMQQILSAGVCCASAPRTSTQITLQVGF